MMLSSGFARNSKWHALRESSRGHSALALGLAWLLLAMPPVGSWLVSTMFGHMLVQIPLLVVCGVAMAHRLHRQVPSLTQVTAAYRWPLMLCAVWTLTVWMLPRLLDLAVESASVNTIKLLSLTLLAGLPIGLAWRSLGPVARGLLHVEALATVWRLGWLYAGSPLRLCTQYGLNDQVRLGQWMLVLGCAYAGWLAMVALAGTNKPE